MKKLLYFIPLFLLSSLHAVGTVPDTKTTGSLGLLQPSTTTADPTRSYGDKLNKDLQIIDSTMTKIIIQVNNIALSTGSTSGGGVGGAFSAFYLVDTLGGKWSITETITGNLKSTSVTSIPAGALAPNQLVTQDASFNLWRITIDTTGHIITTLAGTTSQSITDLLLNDPNSITWVNTVNTSGNMVTQ